MKEEIQQLLKEVSGELKQLQNQLELSQQNQPPPAPGSATDPDLYGESEKLDPAKGEEVPIQIQPDEAPTKTPRAGGGTGASAKNEIGREGPRTGREDAQLSETPTAESSAEKQAIPPEYHDVFDRLNRTPTPTTEGTQ